MESEKSRLSWNALYYFLVEMPDYTYDDPDGTRLPNDAAAKDYARRVARELKETGFGSADAPLHLRDEGGQTIQSIPLSTA